MIGPIVLSLGLGVAGWLAGDLAGAIAGFGVGLLVTGAVAAAAAIWARQIGAVLEVEDAREHAPRPPGFGRLCGWVYGRTLRDPSTAEGRGPMADG